VPDHGPIEKTYPLSELAGIKLQDLVYGDPERLSKTARTAAGKVHTVMRFLLPKLEGDEFQGAKNPYPFLYCIGNVSGEYHPYNSVPHLPVQYGTLLLALHPFFHKPVRDILPFREKSVWTATHCSVNKDGWFASPDKERFLSAKWCRLDFQPAGNGISMTNSPKQGVWLPQHDFMNKQAKDQGFRLTMQVSKNLFLHIPMEGHIEGMTVYHKPTQLTVHFSTRRTPSCYDETTAVGSAYWLFPGNDQQDWFEKLVDKDCMRELATFAGYYKPLVGVPFVRRSRQAGTRQAGEAGTARPTCPPGTAGSTNEPGVTSSEHDCGVDEVMSNDSEEEDVAAVKMEYCKMDARAKEDLQDMFQTVWPGHSQYHFTTNRLLKGARALADADNSYPNGQYSMAAKEIHKTLIDTAAFLIALVSTARDMDWNERSGFYGRSSSDLDHKEVLPTRSPLRSRWSQV